jgi:hypothetical protein
MLPRLVVYEEDGMSTGRMACNEEHESAMHVSILPMSLRVKPVCTYERMRNCETRECTTDSG